MDMQSLTQYFLQYGAIFIFLIVLLEYLNLPGFPAGVIMPLAGIWAARGEISFVMAMVISLAAGVLGSWILYGIGFLGGELFLKRYFKKFPKQETVLKQHFSMIERRGCIGIFISKLIPVIRTVIPFPAGAMRMNFVKYSIGTVSGVFVWNFFLMGAGYMLGDQALKLFA